MAWYWRRFEVHNLKTILRGVHRQQPPDRIKAALIPLGEASRLPWDALAESGSVSAVVEHLSPTPYGRPLSNAMALFRREGRLFVLEITLDLHYYRRLRDMANRLGGDDRAQARRFIGTLIDAQNMLWAFRYRIYAHLSPEEILNYTLHRGVRVDARVIQRIAGGAPLAEVARDIWGHVLPDVERLSDLPETRALPELEHMLLRYAFRLAQDTLAGYPFHLGVILAYLYLVEADMRDIIITLEGKAARRDAERIRPYLIGPRG